MQTPLERAAELLKKIELPPLPEELTALLALQEALDKHYSDTDTTIASLIAHNPELLNQLLELANSDITHLPQTIPNTQTSVNRSGLEEHNTFLEKNS